MFDWIDDYVGSTKHLPSPEIYRLWSAIGAISGVLERKVFTIGAGGPIYPNMFILLVGPPSAGKTTAITPIRNLWSSVKGMNIAPDNVTKAALIDALSRALRTVGNGSNSPDIFSAMSFACSEFGVFFSKHDLEFCSVLNNIYDCPPLYREERRTKGIVEIEKPYLVILAGTQPDFLNNVLPDTSWGMGFTARLLMIYAEKAPTQNLFGNRNKISEELSQKLNEIFAYRGEFVWSKEAADEINAWHEAGAPPKPDHSRLDHYIGKRVVHVIKLAMVSSASRGTGELIVTVEDFERAKDWLISAEKFMPDIFRAMGQKSDVQILTDLHFHAYRIWSSVAHDKRKPIHTDELYKFLHYRVPSERIERLLDVAEKTGYFRKSIYPNEWIPNPLNEVGLETNTTPKS